MAEHHVWDVGAGGSNPLSPTGCAAGESLEDRWLLEAQTARNLEAFEAEQQGRLADAIALYEHNVAEGFPGDLPYGRLVAIYERQSAFDEAERVLLRAVQVFQASTRRTPKDRRATIRVFQQRLKLLQRRRKAPKKPQS